MRLGNLSGTKTTIQKPVITLQANHKFTFSAMAMALLALEEGSRFDFFYSNDDESLYVAKVESKTEGRAISKLGKAQHPAIHSFLADNEQGENAVWEITAETNTFDNILWNKVVLMPSENTETVAESSSDASDEPAREEVAASAVESSETSEETEQEQAEESPLGDDF